MRNLVIWSVLEHQGRNLHWLARATDVSVSLWDSIKCGRRRASPDLRARTALVLGVPEHVLFSPMPAAAPQLEAVGV